MPATGSHPGYYGKGSRPAKKRGRDQENHPPPNERRVRRKTNNNNNSNNGWNGGDPGGGNPADKNTRAWREMPDVEPQDTTLLAPLLEIIDRVRAEQPEQKDPGGKGVEYTGNPPRGWDPSLSILSDRIRQHFEKTRPSEEEATLKQYMRAYVEGTIRDAFPRVTVTCHLFGSSACGLDSAGDDIDLGMEFELVPNLPPEKSRMHKLVRSFRSAVCTDSNGHNYSLKVEPILHAKVPIIKLTDQVQKIRCDLSTWRRQGSVSDLIKEFCVLDTRVRTLIVVIKFWSKQRNINDGKSMKMTSFGWTLLTLKFLQLVGVIPLSPREADPKWRSSNHATLGQLLFGFFEFWSKFDYERLQISILNDRLPLKNTANFDVRQNQTTLIIADPIEIRNNVGRNIRPKVLLEFKQELARAARLCKSQRYDELVEKGVQAQNGWRTTNVPRWAKKGGGKNWGMKKKWTGGIGPPRTAYNRQQNWRGYRGGRSGGGNRFNGHGNRW